MDIKQIKTLAQLMEAHNLNILDVCEGETE
jgi:cell envelope opacity-associated protein A